MGKKQGGYLKTTSVTEMRDNLRQINRCISKHHTNIRTKDEGWAPPKKEKRPTPINVQLIYQDKCLYEFSQKVDLTTLDASTEDGERIYQVKIANILQPLNQEQMRMLTPS